MPFTAAHPAIVLPFASKKRFSTTALIAGSIVPDFEFFFQLREVENIGHHWYGVLLFDFPVALIFCYLFHNLLRNALLVQLPLSIQRRFTEVFSFNWNLYAARYMGIPFSSLALGIASHLFWDAFTHYDGWFVEKFPVLATSIGIAGKQLPVYFLLQLVFSVLGMAIVIFYVYRKPPATLVTRRAKYNWYWPLFATFLLLILTIRISFWEEYNSFWGLFMAAMGAICYSWLLVSIGYYFLSPKKMKL